MPIVNFKGQRVEFPDNISHDEIKRVLGAHAKGLRQQEIVERQEVINQVTPSPWEAQEAQVLLSLVNDCKEGLERPQKDYSDDIGQVIKLVGDVVNKKSPENKDYSPTFKEMSKLLSSINDKESPELSVDVSELLGVMSNCEKLLKSLLAKNPQVKVTPEKKREVKYVDIDRNSAGDAKRLHLFYEDSR